MISKAKIHPLILVAFLAKLGCSGPSEHADANASASSEDSGTNSSVVTSGSTSSGGASGSSSSATTTDGAGGSGTSAASETSSPSTTSSTTGSGGASGLEAGECRSVADCPNMDDVIGPADTRCVSPFQPSGGGVVCGAPDWCGECACPDQAPQPEGLGEACSSDGECVPWGDSPNASLCRVESCVVCESDDDCSAELPHCGNAQGAFGTFYETCVECVLDEHCSAEFPRCVYVDSVGPSCVECISGAECDIGVCVDNACVPGCSSDDDCSNPATGCSENARCEAVACVSDDECPDNTSCSDQTCRRRSCSDDADCEGVCVNGQCHERYGSCSTTYYAP